MIPFDLEKALAGEKVITRDGREVTQITHYEVDSNYCVMAVINRAVVSLTMNGVHLQCSLCVFMAPKTLSGFVNVYANRTSRYLSKSDADNGASKDRIACIDLSKFNEGEGL